MYICAQHPSTNVPMECFTSVLSNNKHLHVIAVSVSQYNPYYRVALSNVKQMGEKLSF